MFCDDDYDTATKVVFGMWIVWFFIVLALGGTSLFVAWHFISKYW